MITSQAPGTEGLPRGRNEPPRRRGGRPADDRPPGDLPAAVPGDLALHAESRAGGWRTIRSTWPTCRCSSTMPTSPWRPGRRGRFPVVLRPEGAGATGDLAWQEWGQVRPEDRPAVPSGRRLRLDLAGDRRRAGACRVRSRADPRSTQRRPGARAALAAATGLAPGPAGDLPRAARAGEGPALAHRRLARRPPRPPRGPPHPCRRGARAARPGGGGPVLGLDLGPDRPSSFPARWPTSTRPCGAPTCSSCPRRRRA